MASLLDLTITIEEPLEYDEIQAVVIARRDTYVCEQDLYLEVLELLVEKGVLVRDTDLTREEDFLLTKYGDRVADKLPKALTECHCDNCGEKCTSDFRELMKTPDIACKKCGTKLLVLSSK